MRHKRLAVSHARELAVIKGKPKGIAERRERSLGRISFGSFQRKLMRFSRGECLALDRCRSLPG